MHLYFAYGANMSDRALRVKGVPSHRARAAVAPGWKLIFSMHAILPSEGHFAGIAPGSPPTERLRCGASSTISTTRA